MRAWMMVSAAGLIWVAGGTSLGSAEPSESAAVTTVRRATPATISTALAAAYGKAEFLTVEAVQTSRPSDMARLTQAEAKAASVELRTVSQMAPGRVRTNVYKDGELAVSIGVEGGVVREYAGGRDAEYAPGGMHGPRTFRLVPELGGLVGRTTRSWVGSDGVMATEVAALIRSGQRLADRTVDGRACFVVRVTNAAGMCHSDDDFYIDQQNLMVVRWTTRGVVMDIPTQERAFAYSSAKPQKPVAWLAAPTPDERTLAGSAASARPESVLAQAD